ncbi:hypothetical protein BDQ17DRAFT_402721 [Cyathus striatus]|nr:hypothetical protein BDQ17DRAFT_402721 [Cyathus striatus]
MDFTILVVFTFPLVFIKRVTLHDFIPLLRATTPFYHLDFCILGLLQPQVGVSAVQAYISAFWSTSFILSCPTILQTTVKHAVPTLLHIHLYIPYDSHLPSLYVHCFIIRMYYIGDNTTILLYNFLVNAVMNVFMF